MWQGYGRGRNDTDNAELNYFASSQAFNSSQKFVKPTPAQSSTDTSWHIVRNHKGGSAKLQCPPEGVLMQTESKFPSANPLLALDLVRRSNNTAVELSPNFEDIIEPPTQRSFCKDPAYAPSSPDHSQHTEIGSAGHVLKNSGESGWRGNSRVPGSLIDEGMPPRFGLGRAMIQATGPGPPLVPGNEANGSIQCQKELGAASCAGKVSSATATKHGLACDLEKFRPDGNLSGLFRGKRDGSFEPESSQKKMCQRPTLAQSLGRSLPPLHKFPQKENCNTREVGSVFKTFKCPAELPETDGGKVDSEVQSPAVSGGSVPCFMAPSSPHEVLLRRDGRTSVRGYSKRLTRHGSPSAARSKGVKYNKIFSSPSDSVHTPPELILTKVTVPGAPVKKKRASHTAFMHPSRSQSSLDIDDTCESAFAPRAPEFHPREDVRRALKFEDFPMDDL